MNKGRPDIQMRILGGFRALSIKALGVRALGCRALELGVFVLYGSGSRALGL